MIIGGVFFLTFLPSTGRDYDYYKEAFDNAHVMESFPWFTTNAVLTSEPFYIWYSSIISVIFKFDFPYFLAFNFILCLLLSYYIFKHFIKTYFFYFWIMFLPVVFPTLFYFSPRSSLSFFLLFAGLVNIIHFRLIIASIFILAGTLMHSQYLLIAALLVVTFFLIRSSGNKRVIQKITIVSIFLFIFLFFIDYFLIAIKSVLFYLPSSKIAISKLHYFSDEDGTSFRITSVLSILVYPLIAYSLFKEIQSKPYPVLLRDKIIENNLISLLFALSCYGAIINLAFFTDPHLAGRLSRFTDYLGIGILIPTFLKRFIGKKTERMAILVLIIITPILYKSLYLNADWGF